MMNAGDLIAHLQEARSRTLELVTDLSDTQLMGPRLAIVNPLLWEIGHVAWFQEKWVLRHLWNLDPVGPEVDRLYDSARIPHDSRWELPLPTRQQTFDYMQEVLARIVEKLESRDPTEEEAYFYFLGLFHEDMHDEAFTYTRQTLGYPPPPMVQKEREAGLDQGEIAGGALPGVIEMEGRTFWLGARPEISFVFDNEKWAHPVEVDSFRISRAPVTNAEFAQFVEDGGYGRQEWWSEKGWEWRQQAGAKHPLYWKRDSNGWFQRRFDQIVPLEDHLPVLHVNWYEADAYCRWSGQRLPSEAEWEMAASSPRQGNTENGKRLFPWGEEPPTRERANLDWNAGGCLEVGALPQSDSPAGCRQMIGNVWEWTASDFLPYPGFVEDPYKEYSKPWFETHKVLRGGCWATRSRLIRNTWRNYYTPDRRDVWAGFRTCALQEPDDF